MRLGWYVRHVRTRVQGVDVPWYATRHAVLACTDELSSILSGTSYMQGRITGPSDRASPSGPQRRKGRALFKPEDGVAVRGAATCEHCAERGRSLGPRPPLPFLPPAPSSLLLLLLLHLLLLLLHSSSAAAGPRCGDRGAAAGAAAGSAAADDDEREGRKDKGEAYVKQERERGGLRVRGGRAEREREEG